MALRPAPGVILLALLVLVGWARPAAAQPALSWWVADARQAQQVQAALEQLWPGHGISVVMGAHAAGSTGVWVEAGELRLVSVGADRRAPCPEPALTQVALVRGWVLEAELPPPSAPPAPGTEAPAPPPIRAAERGPLWLDMGLGPASRRPDRTPVLRYSGRASVLLRSVRLGLDLAWEPGEETTLEQELGSGGARITRLGTGAVLGWALPIPGDSLWELDTFAGPRWIRGRSSMDPGAQAATWRVYCAGLRLEHWRPASPSFVLGGSTLLAVDLPLDPSQQALPEGESPRLRPFTFALELRVARAL